MYNVIKLYWNERLVFQHTIQTLPEVCAVNYLHITLPPDFAQNVLQTIFGEPPEPHETPPEKPTHPDPDDPSPDTRRFLDLEMVFHFMGFKTELQTPPECTGLTIRPQQSA